MAFTRPVKGADISAEDFGQPVYDWIAAATPGVWAGVTFASGDWQNYPTFQPCTYRRVGTTVSLRGVAQRRNANIDPGVTVTMFVLPVGFRPPAALLATALVGFANPGAGRLDIRTDGVVSIQPTVVIPPDGYVGFSLVFWTD